MWSESVLHSFYGSYGGSISGPVAFDTKGNLYGTTINNGDTTDCKGGCGTIFKLLPPASPGGAWGAGWTIKLNGANGQFADGDLIIRADGTIYGTTYEGGEYGFGTVYQIQP
jgi:uncharacterized repeat protein (TIGR03803 family)